MGRLSISNMTGGMEVGKHLSDTVKMEFPDVGPLSSHVNIPVVGPTVGPIHSVLVLLNIVFL